MEDLKVIYEDNHLLIVNKPGGLLVQGDKTGDESLLDQGKRYIKIKYGKPGDVFLGLPHRIDRVTSGLVILSRTSKCLTRMTDLFRNSAVKKTYVAAALFNKNIPVENTLTDYLLKNHEKNISRIITQNKLRKYPKAKEAKLSYKLLKKDGDIAMFEVKLFSGRPHQIRVQLANAGIPILGDLKYGSKRALGKYIALHARKLEFVHPVKAIPLILEADFPASFPWIKLKANQVHPNNIK